MLTIINLCLLMFIWNLLTRYEIIKNEIVFKPSNGGYIISRLIPKKNARGNNDFDFIRILINIKYAIKKLGMIENNAKCGATINWKYRINIPNKLNLKNFIILFL